MIETPQNPILFIICLHEQNPVINQMHLFDVRFYLKPFPKDILKIDIIILWPQNIHTFHDNLLIAIFYKIGT